jgi:hypothetical protein
MALFYGALPCAKRGEIQNVVNELRDNHSVDGVVEPMWVGICLREAASNNHLPLVEFLVREYGAGIPKEHIEKAAWGCSHEGHYKILRWFLREGVCAFSSKIWKALRTIPTRVDDGSLSSLLKTILKVDYRVDFDFTEDKFFSQQEHRDIIRQGSLIHKFLPNILIEQGTSIATHCPLPIVISDMITEYAKLNPEEDVMWAEDMQRDLLRIETDIINNQRRLKRAHEDAYEARAREKWAKSSYNRRF